VAAGVACFTPALLLRWFGRLFIPCRTWTSVPTRRLVWVIFYSARFFPFIFLRTRVWLYSSSLPGLGILGCLALRFGGSSVFAVQYAHAFVNALLSHSCVSVFLLHILLRHYAALACTATRGVCRRVPAWTGCCGFAGALCVTVLNIFLMTYVNKRAARAISCCVHGACAFSLALNSVLNDAMFSISDKTYARMRATRPGVCHDQPLAPPGGVTFRRRRRVRRVLFLRSDSVPPPLLADIYLSGSFRRMSDGLPSNACRLRRFLLVVLRLQRGFSFGLWFISGYGARGSRFIAAFIQTTGCAAVVCWRFRRFIKHAS